MSIDEMIAVLQACKDYKTIQARKLHNAANDDWWEWCRTPVTCFNFHDYEYRVKPEPREWWISTRSAGVFDHPTETRPDLVRVREVIE